VGKLSDRVAMLLVYDVAFKIPCPHDIGKDSPKDEIEKFILKVKAIS
jgi:hypothetical protein